MTRFLSLLNISNEKFSHGITHGGFRNFKRLFAVRYVNYARVMRLETKRIYKIRRDLLPVKRRKQINVQTKNQKTKRTTKTE